MKKLKYKDTELDIDKQREGQLAHNKLVKSNGELLTKEMNERLSKHDKDKLNDLDIWARFQIVSKSGIKFGTKEYKELVESLDVEKILLKHRKNNAHHPEYFDNDFSKMNLIDLTELVSDWYTANSTRPSGAKIKDMLDYQQNLYKFSDDVRNIIENTINFLEEKNH